MNDIDIALELTRHYLYSMDETDKQLLPDIITIKLHRDAVMIRLCHCEDEDDLNKLIVYTENIVTMLQAKECHSEFFEILHDYAVVTLINLTESCEVIDAYMYGWEAYIGVA